MRGMLWPIDRYGRVANAGDRAALTPLVRRVSRAVADGYRTRLGTSLHSVYLTGSAARGRPGPIEVFGVIRKPASMPVDDAWLDDVAGAIRARWPGAGLPDLALYPWEDAFPAPGAFSPANFRLAVNSVCLTGRDLSTAIPPRPLSIAAANSWIVRIRGALDSAWAEASEPLSEEETWRLGRAAGRFILSAGFAFVMVNEGVYTEDPDLQRDFICLNYPERAVEAVTAYAFAVDPPSSASELRGFLNGAARWFEEEAERWLDQHNPARMVALPA